MKRLLKQTILGRPAVAGALLGVGLIGVTLGGVASAQTPVPGETNPAATFIQRLAQNLGLPQEQVEQALTATRNDALNDAVASGRLTQAQADEIRNRPIDEGRGFGFGIGGRGGKLGGRGVSHEAAAQILGMSAEELRTQLHSGQSLAQIAQARGISVETLVAGLVSAAETQIAQAVQEGRLTEAQAAEQRANLAERIRQKVESVKVPGERGPRPDRAPATAPTTAPSA